jgi:hypothetical protein
VSVAITEEAIYVRDTKDQSKTTLHFTRSEWVAFLKGVGWWRRAIEWHDGCLTEPKAYGDSAASATAVVANREATSV